MRHTNHTRVPSIDPSTTPLDIPSMTLQIDHNGVTHRYTTISTNCIIIVSEVLLEAKQEDSLYILGEEVN